MLAGADSRVAFMDSSAQFTPPSHNIKAHFLCRSEPANETIAPGRQETAGSHPVELAQGPLAIPWRPAPCAGTAQPITTEPHTEPPTSGVSYAFRAEMGVSADDPALAEGVAKGQVPDRVGE